jgi:hypothetical protein
MPFPTKYYRQIGTASGIDGVVACGTARTHEPEVHTVIVLS